MGASECGAEGGMGEGHEEKILVSVRIRPLNRKEISRNDVCDWGCVNEDTVVYRNTSVSVPDRSLYPTAYTFDRVFSCDCTTRQVYKEGARDVALSVLTGVNSSIFAYGQTSSGKTFTMTGITEYTIADIYDYVQKHTEREFLLKFSAMEIYNESVRDLLSIESIPLRLLDDPERGTIVEKLTEETVRDWSHVMELLSICEAQRQIGETSLNETSSRSHQIIRLTIESSSRELLGKDSLSTLVATVNFVDLAGSERASQSLSAGTRLKEGCHINRSLLTLGTVIRKLSKGRNSHVPFRDSKLTRILQSSLGGNARTAIICTMSPARSHVEQSRNTLLFASCAKEVSTNAQVNVVISDKALVKHLQRELARLESELSSPASQFLTSKLSALIREKDLRIDKLEKEVTDLTMQRDAAQSQVKDMLRLIGNEGHLLTAVGCDPYTHVKVPLPPDARHLIHEMSSSGHPHSMDVSDRTVCISPFFDGQSANSFNNKYLKLQGDFKDNFQHIDTSSRLLISTSQFSASDSCLDLKENDEKGSGTSEDVCKEVRCIEIDECSTNSYIESNCLSAVDNIDISARTVDQEVDSYALQVDGEFASLPSKERRELIIQFLKGNREFVSSSGNKAAKLTSMHMKEATQLSCTTFVNPSLERLPPFHDQTEEFSRSKSTNLARSTSSKSGVLINVSSSWPEKFANNENISQSSMGSVVDFELESQQKILTNESISNANTGNGEIKNTAEHASQIPANETKSRSNVCLKSVKNIGLDPMEDGFRSPSNWSSEFKRLQRELIEFWHSCNVSLVHRTHFFLLFQGDPTDSIYIEVELRRLSFLKDTFSQGNQTMEDGRTLTHASSLKALRHERQLLSYQIQRQFSKSERESLYHKWGIAVKGKQRRVQLAGRLWTSTDIDHIADSAIVVAKLVGLIEPGHSFKEMFGLKFAPWNSKRSGSFRRSLLSIL